MYQPPIVNFPVFSVTWSECTDDDGTSTPAVLTAGGGGAGKTGVGNKISLIAVKGGASQPSHKIAHEVETSPETCNCVAASIDGQLMAAAFGKSVRIYASNPSGFHFMVEVQADFADKESGINSMAFGGRITGGGSGGGIDTLLATGGEDGVLRVWKILADGRSGGDGFGEMDKPPSLAVEMVGECKGHTKPVTCVRFHPAGSLVLTSSKDGTCRLWDWQRSSEAALLPTTSGLPPSAATSRAPVIMCRSCCFSPDKPDTTIFSVQSGGRGNAYVTQWRYSVVPHRGDDDSRGSGEGIQCQVKPLKVSLVSPYPATSCSVRSDGKRLAVGNVEGTVLVYRLPGFTKVLEYPAHDLPVTGLGFAPREAGVALGGYDLLAGSADYKITLFKSQGSTAKLAAKQLLALLWWIVAFPFRAAFWLARAAFWLVRTLVSLLMTIIPIVGLVVLVLAVVYNPEELAALLRELMPKEVAAVLRDLVPDEVAEVLRDMVPHQISTVLRGLVCQEDDSGLDAESVGPLVA